MWTVPGTLLPMAEKNEGLVIAVLATAVRMNNSPRRIKKLPSSHFPTPKIARITSIPFPKPEQRLEDWKVWIRACGRPHGQTLELHTGPVFAKAMLKVAELMLIGHDHGSAYCMLCQHWSSRAISPAFRSSHQLTHSLRANPGEELISFLFIVWENAKSY